MKLKNLFQDSNVAYLSIADNLQKLESSLFAFACYNNIKIKLTTGYFINPASEKVERVLKVELIEGTLENKPKAQKNAREGTKRAEIQKRYLAGEKQIKIAKELGVSRQYVNQEIKQIKKISKYKF